MGGCEDPSRRQGQHGAVRRRRSEYRRVRGRDGGRGAVRRRRGTRKQREACRERIIGGELFAQERERGSELKRVGWARVQGFTPHVLCRVVYSFGRCTKNQDLGRESPALNRLRDAGSGGACAPVLAARVMYHMHSLLYITVTEALE